MHRPPRRLSADPFAFAVGLALGAAVLVVFGFVEIWRAALGSADFSSFWVGPRAALDGVNPYDPSRFPDVVRAYGTSPTEPVYGYPPWDLVLLLPFALLPVATAAVVWTVFGLGVAIYGLVTLLRREAPGLLWVHFLAGLALLASQPAVITFYSGQWGFLLAGLLALSARWLHEGRSARAGLAAIVMAIKPQLLLFTAWAMTRAAFARGQRTFVATAGVVGFVLVAGAWLAFPDWFGAFLRYIAPMRTTDPPIAVTVATPLVELLGPVGVWLAVPIIAGALVVALCFRPTSEAWLAVWIPLSVALTTYAWSYDHIVLIVPLVLAGGAARGSPRRAAMIWSLGFAALLIEPLVLYQFAIERRSQSLNVLVPFTMFAVIAIALWPLRRGSEPKKTLFGTAPRTEDPEPSRTPSLT